MTARPLVLEPTLTVNDFVNQVALTHRFSTYPLVDPAGRLIGLVTLNRVRSVPPAERATTHLWQIACAPADVPVARPEDLVVELLARMHGCADGRAVALDDAGRVVGVVSPSDIARAMQGANLRSLDPYAAGSGPGPTQTGLTQ